MERVSAENANSVAPRAPIPTRAAIGKWRTPWPFRTGELIEAANGINVTGIAETGIAESVTGRRLKGIVGDFLNENGLTRDPGTPLTDLNGVEFARREPWYESGINNRRSACAVSSAPDEDCRLPNTTGNGPHDAGVDQNDAFHRRLWIWHGRLFPRLGRKASECRKRASAP